MKPPHARLHVLLAPQAQIGLVILHGTAQSVCTLLWDRKRDKFKLGQWMRGRIDVSTCDLSPAGEHFLYSAVNSRAQGHSNWTAVSRTPYLKAVAFYPGRGAGGWFVNDYCYSAPAGGPHPDDRESPEVRRVELDPPPPPSLYAARLARADWSAVDSQGQFRGRLEFVRPAGSGWELRHYERGGYRLSCGELIADTAGWDWADMDGKRLVWTVKGCLWAGMVRKDGVQQVRLLHDFNGMKFEPLAAPYAGGQPVRPRPAATAPVSAVPRRKGSRKPLRKKPNRSKVRPGQDD